MDLSVIAKIAAFVLYLGAMIFVGLRNAKNNNSASDFFLGNRKVGPWITALSAEASDSSAWLLMGLPGLCYLGGFKETLWTSVGHFGWLTTSMVYQYLYLFLRRYYQLHCRYLLSCLQDIGRIQMRLS